MADFTRADLQEAVLSYLIFRPAELWHVDIGEQHFTEGRYRGIFRGILAQVMAGATHIDLNVIVDHARERAEPVRLADLTAIAKLEASDVKALTAALRKAWLRREAHAALRKAELALANDAEDPRDVLVAVQEQQAALLRGTVETSLIGYGEALAARAKEIAARRPNQAEGVCTGFVSLDRLTGGLPRGLSFIGGRPGKGKSSLIQQVCEQVARRGTRVLLCTPEMDWRSVADRGIARHLGIDLHHLRTRNLTRDEQRLVAGIVPPTLDFMIYDAPRQTTKDITAVAQRQAAAGKLELIGVDYIQYLNDPMRKGETRQQLIGRMVRALKSLARELECAVLVGAQLRRDVEGDAREPRLSDLKESGDIEQDADLVMLLHWPQEDEVRAIVAKHRQGPCGFVTFKWDGGCTRFVDPDSDTGPFRDAIVTVQ